MDPQKCLKYIYKNGTWSVIMSISISLALILTPLTLLNSTNQTWKILCTTDPHKDLLKYESRTILNHDHINLTTIKIHMIMETNG